MQQSEPSALRHLGALAEVGWLAGQSSAFQGRMAQAGRWQTIGPGKSIYVAGDDPDALFGLGVGLLDVAVPVTVDEQVTIHRAEPGFWVGDSAILAGTTRTISVVAAVESRLFRIPAVAIWRDLQDHPADWQCFYMLSHINANNALRVLAEVLSQSPRARFARMLLRLADPQGLVRVTQSELAGMAGMNRATFRRAFADLIADGVVQTEYGGLRVNDRVALEDEVRKG